MNSFLANDNMKKKSVSIILIVQIFIILAVTVQIYNKKKDVMGVSVNPITKYEIISSPSGALSDFYESQVGDMTKDLSFMGKKYNYSVTYKINKDSLNQLKDYPVEKGKGVFRIITLGASFTFGANVNTKDNYPMQLQNMFDAKCNDGKKYEVINLGMGGYDIEYSVERLKVKGMKYDPDLVLWLITDDNFRVIKNIPEEALRNLPEETLINMQKERIKRSFEIYQNALVLIGSKNLAWQHKNLLKRITEIRPNTYLFIDTPDIYKKNAVFPDKHPNKKGYGLIAESVLEYLKEEKLVTCN